MTAEGTTIGIIYGVLTVVCCAGFVAVGNAHAEMARRPIVIARVILIMGFVFANIVFFGYLWMVSK